MQVEWRRAARGRDTFSVDGLWRIRAVMFNDSIISKMFWLYYRGSRVQWPIGASYDFSVSEVSMAAVKRWVAVHGSEVVAHNDP